MSRRGGEGRRSDPRHDQPSPSTGRGGGGRGGGGRGGGGRGEGGRGGGGRGGGRGEGRGEGGGGGRGEGGRGGGGRGGGGRGEGGGGRGYGAVAGSSSRPATDFPPLASPSASASSSVASLSQQLDQSMTLQSSGRRAQAPSAAGQVSSPPIQVQPVTPESQALVTQPTKEPIEGKTEVPPSTSKAITFPKRPGYGTLGRKCVIRSNHFQVQVDDRDFYHYDVTITPEVLSKRLNREIVSRLVELYKESHLGNRTPAYDGSKSLYTAGSLPFSSKDFVVKLDETNGQDGPRRERNFKVAIKYASQGDLYQLQQFLCGRQFNAPQEIIQILDVVLRASPSCNYTVVGRSFFSTKLGPKGELADGLEYWRGYYQSLRPTQMGLSLNIDVSARSFYEPILVTKFVEKHLGLRDMSQPLSDHNCVKIKKALKGVKVLLTHREFGKRFKITGVSRQPTSQLMFTSDDNGTRMSVVQYFRQKYNIVLRYASWPSLQAGSDQKPVYLPMEVCQIVDGQRYTKKLNERQVTALLRATCQRPSEREKSIEAMVRQNKFSTDRIVRDEFGIHVKEQLTLVDARVLPPPKLKYHDTGRETNVDPLVGQWNMINKKMVNGGTVQFWTCLNFSTKVQPDLPSRFCYELIEMCSSKGMVFNQNPLLPIKSAHPSQIEKALLDVHKQSVAKLASMGENGKALQLLIIILPDITGSYGKIKRICETELGIVSQCCQPRQASKLNKQYFENVALKINVKVGGRNTVLFDAIQRRIPLVSDCPTIIFGADVTHPQPGEDSSPSIAAVVASMDWPEVTKYRGLVSAQHHREEIIQDLYKTSTDPQRGIVHGGMIRELLIAYRRSTGYKPHRIIFYRDGVSEGQFSQVLLHEMDALRKACASLEEGYLPPVTFVVVQKRHHTRFFPSDHSRRDLTDRSGNILPGTVVDTKICHPTEFDFYLNSHAGIQGTSRPTHYHVLYDENKFTADILQMLTNHLCYTYARCTRSVSIVPPAYYAHLAAFRARYYIEGETSDSGSGSGDKSTRDKNVEVRLLPAVKENVKDVMFYC